MNKLQRVPVMKRKFQKTAGASPKNSSVYNLRSKDQTTEGVKDPSNYNLRSKAQKTEGQNASRTFQKKKTLKTEGSKDSTPSIKKIETTKALTTSLADIDKKNLPLTSQYEPFFCEPMYHIRWEGDDMENGLFGQNCILCNKDLSGLTEDDDSEFNDDLQNDDDDDDDDDDYEYYDDLNPPLLPAVDILACGHAYHTECLQKGISEEQSSDPRCVLCSKTV